MIVWIIKEGDPMTLRQLEYLIEVADQGSISVAARKLMISQPSLSQCIKSIEEELNITLFDRSSVPMLPTKAGEVVLNKAHIIMTALGDMKKELSQVENAPQKLVVGLLDAGSLINKHIFRQFQDQCPNVKLLLVERDQHLLERMLGAGKLDMMLSMTPSESSGLEVIPLVEDSFLIALPKTHPASLESLEKYPDMIGPDGKQVRFPSISLSKCEDVQFVLSGRDRLKVAQITALRNLAAPSVGFETDSLSSAVSIAAYEPHGTIVPKMFSVLYDGPDKPFFFTCAEPFPKWNFALSIKKGSRLSDAGYQYIQLFTAHIQSLGLLSEACNLDSLMK